MNELLNDYPFLKELIYIFEKKQTLIYLGDEEYHSIQIEFALDELLDDANSELDKLLPKTLSIEDRYKQHDLLERTLWKHDYMYIIEQFGNWFANQYDYWDEEDSHADCYNQLFDVEDLGL